LLRTIVRPSRAVATCVVIGEKPASPTYIQFTVFSNLVISSAFSDSFSLHGFPKNPFGIDLWQA
jgi:hypothetical protein